MFALLSLTVLSQHIMLVMWLSFFHGKCTVQVSQETALEQAATIDSLRWNTLGTSLAVATSVPTVTVWRQDLLGSWQAVDRIAGTQAAMSID